MRDKDLKRFQIFQMFNGVGVRRFKVLEGLIYNEE